MEVNKKRERIVIYGGSFNPVHNGHIALARHMMEALHPRKMLLMPTASPPHKQVGEADLVSGEHRMAMCRLAVGQVEGLTVCGYEMEKGGVSYTADTLEEMARRYPQDQLVLCMGGDMFLTVDRWYHPEEIFRLAFLATAARTHSEYERLWEKSEQLTRIGARCQVYPFSVLEISSTQVREAVRRGESLQGMVPREVEDYIRQWGLYRAR